MENFLKVFFHILLIFMAINFALTDYLNTNFSDNYAIESKQPAGRVFGCYRKSGEKWGTYTVLLVQATDRAKYFGARNFCCEALVNVQTVITAGHCVDALPSDLRKSSLRVIINSQRRLQRTGKTLYKKVLKAVTHRKYADRLEGGDNDIALLILYSPIKKRVDYLIPLNPRKNNMDCVAIGWGQIFPNGPSPDRILFVDMRLTATKTCNIVHGAFNKHALCAIAPQPAKGLCKGDSGAPLFCNGKIYGLQGAASSDDHEIYVSVYRHSNWIKENMIKIRRRAAKACQHACAPMLLFLPMFI